jgi:hypothetical protein
MNRKVILYIGMMFWKSFPEQKLMLIQSTSFGKDFVQLHYIRVRD